MISSEGRGAVGRGNLKLPGGLDTVAVELGYPMTSHFQSRRRDISQERERRPAGG